MVEIAHHTAGGSPIEAPFHATARDLSCAKALLEEQSPKLRGGELFLDIPVYLMLHVQVGISKDVMSLSLAAQTSPRASVKPFCTSESAASTGTRVHCLPSRHGKDV